jgi:phosphatidylserine decarboxylase
VVVIEKVYESEYYKAERLQISVFMNPNNVHVNWCSIGGQVLFAKYHPGKHLVAWHPKSSTDNERTTIVIEDDQKRSVLLRQIAGAVARRVVYYMQEGMAVIKGQELGFIKFGSRMDVFFTLGC